MAGGPLGDVEFFCTTFPSNYSCRTSRTRMTVRELAELAKDDVIELDRLASQPLDILAGGQVFARGEVVVVDDRVALRVIELVGALEDEDE